jgi:hypothetical protein
MAEPSRKVKDLVGSRAEWKCEVCGLPLLGEYYSFHHRRGRGMGGSKDPAANEASNLMLLHGSGTTGCHGFITEHPATAKLNGWVVSRWSKPAEIPVLVFSQAPHMVLLDDDGNYVTENN